MFSQVYSTYMQFKYNIQWQGSTPFLWALIGQTLPNIGLGLSIVKDLITSIHYSLR